MSQGDTQITGKRAEPVTSTEEILDYRVYSERLAECIDEIGRGIANKEPGRWLACLNPHSYVVSRSDPLFDNALKSATWLIPDGIGVVFASILLGGKIRRRITGSDLFSGIQHWLNSRGNYSVFLLGSTEDVVKRMVARIRLEFPDVRVSGYASPAFVEQFSEEEVAEMASMLARAEPDVVWVGLSAPKQEKLIERLSRLYAYPFYAGIGAVFDFQAGTVTRSGVVFQALGLEWLPRLARQPRRLWRRTLVSAPIFVGKLVLRKFYGGKGRF